MARTMKEMKEEGGHFIGDIRNCILLGKEKKAI